VLCCRIEPDEVKAAPLRAAAGRHQRRPRPGGGPGRRAPTSTP